MSSVTTAESMTKPRAAASWLPRAAVCLLLVAAAGGWLAYDRLFGPPKRFGVVEPGRLYRSGEVTPRDLEHLQRDHRIQTVLSLLNPEVPESVAERAAAERLGLRWINIPLSGDGSSTPEARAQIKSVLFDDSLGATLVHCAAGANRTGLAVGMYRIHRDGWSVERVLDEMRRYDFEDLPKHENLRAALREEATLRAGSGE